MSLAKHIVSFFFHNSTLLMLHAKSWTSFKVKMFLKKLEITYADDFWVFTYSDVTDVMGKNKYLTKLGISRRLSEMSKLRNLL